MSRSSSRVTGSGIVLPALFMTMEAAWLAVLVLAVETLLPSPRQPWIALGLCAYPMAYALARVIGPARWRPVWNVLAGILCGLLVLGVGGWAGGLPLWSSDALAARPYLAGLLGTTLAVAVARGWILEQRLLDCTGVAAGFQFGVFVLLLIAVLEHMSSQSAVHFIECTIVFVATGLFALRLARDAEGSRPVGPARVTATMTAAVGILLVIGLGILAHAEIDHALMAGLLAPVFWLVDVLGQLLQWLFSLLPEPGTGTKTALPVPTRAPPPNLNPFIEKVEWMRFIGGIMFYSSTGIAMVMLLFRTLFDLLRWLKRRRPGTVSLRIEKSDYGIWDEILSLVGFLVNWIARIWRRSRRRADRAATPEARTIREAYRRLLAWAADQDCPRSPAQTPHEFFEVLHPRLPEAVTDLRTLTEAYVASRYGAAPPAPRVLSASRAAWRRLRRLRLQPDSIPNTEGT